MKLLFCQSCYDVIALCFEHRECLCKRSSGHYKDKLNVEVSGPCLVLGFSNPSLLSAVSDQLVDGDRNDNQGRTFEAFILPNECSSVERV